MKDDRNYFLLLSPTSVFIEPRQNWKIFWLKAHYLLIFHSEHSNACGVVTTL